MFYILIHSVCGVTSPLNHCIHRFCNSQMQRKTNCKRFSIFNYFQTKQVATVMMVTVSHSHRAQTFNCICQEVTICTPSNTIPNSTLLISSANFAWHTSVTNTQQIMTMTIKTVWHKQSQVSGITVLITCRVSHIV